LIHKDKENLPFYRMANLTSDTLYASFSSMLIFDS
jgi:hypothetical protein